MPKSRVSFLLGRYRYLRGDGVVLAALPKRAHRTHPTTPPAQGVRSQPDASIVYRASLLRILGLDLYLARPPRHPVARDIPHLAKSGLRNPSQRAPSPWTTLAQRTRFGAHGLPTQR
ncbi:hypothetical protein GQ53DRAFT_420146 [Thozetella sp. PMI_491]|nr:hypothetical protein GQ53DRAFT_420146 [Thozetella sp. PMI_491]